MIDSVATHVRSFLDQAAVPEGDTDVLFTMADGKAAPAISSAEHPILIADARYSWSDQAKHFNDVLTVVATGIGAS